MNRIKISPLANQKHAASQNFPTQIAKLEQDWKINSRFLEERFSLFVPMYYEKKYAYPLIVWLHQDGANADEIQQIMPNTSLRNFVAIGVQGAQPCDSQGFYWEQDWNTIDYAQLSVEAAIDQASVRCNINTDRVFIGGMGAGGTMALRLALSNPDLFAGVMSIDGPLPGNHAPLRGWKSCRKLPVYWAHDRSSAHFSQDQLCDQLQLFHIAGFSITLRQYPQTGLLKTQALSDMNRWIMEMIQTAVLD